jgi:hypothetical protein
MISVWEAQRGIDVLGVRFALSFFAGETWRRERSLGKTLRFRRYSTFFPFLHFRSYRIPGYNLWQRYWLKFTYGRREAGKSGWKRKKLQAK